MFLCGNFCNNGQVDNSQVLVSKFSDIKKFEDSKSEKSSLSQNNSKKSHAHILSSNYNNYYKQCKRTGQSFIDNQFPPNQKSLNFSIPNREIVWVRISEILKNRCVMVQNDINPSDIHQGNIGDCYFLATIAALAQTPQLIRNIFFNNFQFNEYGLYKVVANYRGNMAQVLIDDYIPVFKSTNRPVFCKANGKQIWVVLLQKAWAKIKGSYGNIASGTPHQVFNTFCLAPAFNHIIHDSDSDDYKDAIWQHLLNAAELNMPTCAGSKKQVFLNGLKPLHTYTVLNCLSFPVKGKNRRIIRMRNPWGETQYNGPANENDQSFWNQVPNQYKTKILPAAKADDGDFVLPFNEFIKHFQTIDICHYRNAFNYEFEKINMIQNEPTFIKLDVKQDHEAYLTLQKVSSSKLAQEQFNNNNYGYTRMIIAKQQGQRYYQYYDSKLQTSFGDTTIQSRLIKGIYLIMIQADYPIQQPKFLTILSYYYQNLESQNIKHIQIIRNNKQQFIEFYLKSVFESHARRMATEAQTTYLKLNTNNWIKTSLLYQKGGFGYVACNIEQNVSFKLKVQINIEQIQANGYKLITSNMTSKEIQPDSFEIYVFSLKLQDKDIQQLSFPPRGFKVSKYY